MASTTTAAKIEVQTEAKAGTKDKTTPDAKIEPKTEAKDAAASDAGSGTETETSTSDAPTGYSRGENQKLVTEAYRNNWDAVFGKKLHRGSKKKSP
jgi:hypothetical protein